MGSSNAYWFVPQHIVYVHNVGDLTSDDFRNVDRQIIALMQEAQGVHSGNVHVLVDSTELTKLPPVTHLEGGRILKYMQEPNCGWTVVVGHNNPFLKILSRLLTSISRVDFYMANTLKQGARMFLNVDDSLDDIPDVEAWKAANLTYKAVSK